MVIAMGCNRYIGVSGIIVCVIGTVIAAIVVSVRSVACVVAVALAGIITSTWVYDFIGFGLVASTVAYVLLQLRAVIKTSGLIFDLVHLTVAGTRSICPVGGILAGAIIIGFGSSINLATIFVIPRVGNICFAIAKTFTAGLAGVASASRLGKIPGVGNRVVVLVGATLGLRHHSVGNAGTIYPRPAVIRRKA